MVTVWVVVSGEVTGAEPSSQHVEVMDVEVGEWEGERGDAGAVEGVGTGGVRGGGGDEEQARRAGGSGGEHEHMNRLDDGLGAEKSQGSRWDREEMERTSAAAVCM